MLFLQIRDESLKTLFGIEFSVLKKSALSLISLIKDSANESLIIRAYF